MGQHAAPRLQETPGDVGQHTAPRLCRGIVFFRFASGLLPECVLGLRVQRVLSGVEEESNMKPPGRVGRSRSQLP